MNPAVTGDAENIISSSTQMLSVPDATVVTPLCTADKVATGFNSTCILITLLGASQVVVPVLLTVILLKKVSETKTVVGV